MRSRPPAQPPQLVPPPARQLQQPPTKARSPLSDLSDLQLPLAAAAAVASGSGRQRLSALPAPAGCASRAANASSTAAEATAAGSKRKRTLLGRPPPPAAGRSTEPTSAARKAPANDGSALGGEVGGRGSRRAGEGSGLRRRSSTRTTTATGGSTRGEGFGRPTSNRSTSSSASRSIPSVAHLSSDADEPPSSPAPAFDLIDPSDDHLISHAPRSELARVRRAELVRLWRVAGLLDDDDEVEGPVGEGDNAGAGVLRKGELVDGLVEARTTAAHRLTLRRSPPPSPSPSSLAASPRLSPSSSPEEDSDRAESDDSNPTPRRRQRLLASGENGHHHAPPSPASSRSSSAASSAIEDDYEEEDGEGPTETPPKRRSTRSSTSTASASAGGGSAAAADAKSKGKERERPLLPSTATAAAGRRVVSTPVGVHRLRGRPTAATGGRPRTDEEEEGEGEDEPTPRAAMGILPKRRHSSTAAAAAAAAAAGPTGRAHRRTASTSTTTADLFTGPATGNGRPSPSARRLTRRSSAASTSSASASSSAGGVRSARTRRSSSVKNLTPVEPPSATARRRPRRKAKAKALEAIRNGEESSSSSSSDSDGYGSDEGGSDEEEEEGSAYSDDDDDDGEMHVDGSPSDERTPGGRTRRRSPRRARRQRPTRTSAGSTGSTGIEPLKLLPRRGSGRGKASVAVGGRQQPTPPSEDEDDADVEPTVETELATAVSDDDDDDDDDAPSPPEAEEVDSSIPRAAKRSGLRTLKAAVVDPIAEEVNEDEAMETETVADENEAGEVEMEEDDDEDGSRDGIELGKHTATTLGRLRRDSLVRLCTMRELDVAGTKPQLAQALIDWRDGNVASDDSGATSPAPLSSRSTARLSRSTARPASSTGTVKTAGSGRRKTAGRRLHADDPAFATDAKVTPTLLRGSHVHQEQTHPSPTPPPSGHAHQAIAAEELNLDLESLGLEDKEIPAGQLVKMEKVGSGGFKDVYVGKLRGRAKVAIAEFRGQLGEMDIKELKLLADFRHANIVKFLGVSIPDDRRTPIMMVSELCENGDLFDYIRNVPAPAKKVVIKLMLDISRGLQYLHLHKPAVIHRDCKSSNILITSRVVAKVGDFGLARVKHSTRSMVRSLVGTVCYQPPEMWTAHPKYDSKVDVYSCAMVFWEMLQWHKADKKYPWEGQNEHWIYDHVGKKHQRPSVHRLAAQWGADIVELMEEMWVQEPKERPTMTTVVERLEAILKTC